MKRSLIPIFMKKISSLSVMSLLVFGILLLTIPARATTITADVTYDTFWNFTYDGSTAGWATEYWLEGTGANDFYLDVFCIQSDEAELNNGLYTLRSLDTYLQGKTSWPREVAWIANEYYTDSTWKDSYTKSQTQAAIWEFLFEDTEEGGSINYNISEGRFFKTYNSDRGNIQIIIDRALDEFIPSDDFSGIQVAQIDGHQDYIYHTPEPATMLLFGVGLIGLAGVIRKKII